MQTVWATTPASVRSRYPAITDDHARLAAIIALTRAQLAHPERPPPGRFGSAFRLLSRLGLFRAFVVLSYADVLGVTLVADPPIVPDQDTIAESFQAVCQRLLST